MFATPLALTGLVLLAPVVLAHLTRRGRRRIEVPSLQMWRDLQAADGRSRALRLRRASVLVLIQVATVILLIVASAQPIGAAEPAPATRIYVVDDSIWMDAQGRLGAEITELNRLLRSQSRGASATIAVAAPTPFLVHGDAIGTGVSEASLALKPQWSPVSLEAALALALAATRQAVSAVVVLHAPEDPVPALSVRRVKVTSIAIGGPITDQAIYAVPSQCNEAVDSPCLVHATIVNDSRAAARDRYVVRLARHPPISASVRIGPMQSHSITAPATPGAIVRIALTSHDAISQDDVAWVRVSAQAPLARITLVTLVGLPSTAGSVGRALAAVPGVRTEFQTPTRFAPMATRTSDLTVLDGWSPASVLPQSPGLLFVAPPRLPGGSKAGWLANSTIAEDVESSPLLEGVDLDSLVIQAKGARATVLPRYLVPILASPAGPLLAAGTDGSHRIVVLSIDPNRSDLPQLPAFPLLLANILRWAVEWCPPSGVAGQPVLVDGLPGATRLNIVRPGQKIDSVRLDGHPASFTPSAPGVYMVTEYGPGVRRTATTVVGIPRDAGAETRWTPASGGLPGGASGRHRSWLLLELALGGIMLEAICATVGIPGDAPA